MYIMLGIIALNLLYIGHTLNNILEQFKNK
jgi:hypothetical protein